MAGHGSQCSGARVHIALRGDAHVFADQPGRQRTHSLGAACVGEGDENRVHHIALTEKLLGGGQRDEGLRAGDARRCAHIQKRHHFELVLQPQGDIVADRQPLGLRIVLGDHRVVIVIGHEIAALGHGAAGLILPYFLTSGDAHRADGLLRRVNARDNRGLKRLAADHGQALAILLHCPAAGFRKTQVAAAGRRSGALVDVECPQFQDPRGLFDRFIIGEFGDHIGGDGGEVLGKLDDAEGAGLDPLLNDHVGACGIQRGGDGLFHGPGDGDHGHQEADAEDNADNCQHASSAPAPEAFPRILQEHVRGEPPESVSGNGGRSALLQAPHSDGLPLECFGPRPSTRAMRTKVPLESLQGW